MRPVLAVLLPLLALAVTPWHAQAGDLEPPGPPGPTMVTLQQIADKVDACVDQGLCGVPKTGLTGCWNALEEPIDCAGTGQDGEHQTGVAIDPRFTDNADGTVTDNLTGLIWLKDAGCLGTTPWESALSAVAGLAGGSCGLTDGSEAGDWRMPNIRELHSLIDLGSYHPALPDGHPFTNVFSSHYHSSTNWVAYPSYTWRVNVDDGDITTFSGIYNAYIWPVRGGQ